MELKYQKVIIIIIIIDDNRFQVPIRYVFTGRDSCRWIRSRYGGQRGPDECQRQRRGAGLGGRGRAVRSVRQDDRRHPGRTVAGRLPVRAPGRVGAHRQPVPSVHHTAHALAVQ